MSNSSFHPRVDVGCTTLYDKLRAPYGLSDHQRAEVSELIKEADKDLDAYEAEIHLLENKLTLLRSQRERLLDHKSSLSSLFSQIHRLPNELLTRVFVFACEESDLKWGSWRSGDAMSISAVCSRWRSLAISCSEVWSRFSISLGSKPSLKDRTNRILGALLDVYLERSKQQPLSLFIEAQRCFDENDDDAVKEHPLLKTLVQTSPRWQHVAFEVFQFSSGAHPSLGALDLPALETLSIQQIDETPVELHLLSSAARLHTLDVENCSPTDADVPLLDHITSLEYTPHVETLFEILDLCPNLRNLELKSFDFEHDLSNPSHRTVSLSSLCVCFAEWVEGERGMLEIIMESLTAPSLSSLTLNQTNMRSFLPSYKPRVRPFRLIDAFLERSACVLTALQLSRLSISDKEVVALLKRLRSLVDLKIEDPVGDAKQYTLPVTKALVESLHTHRKSSLQSSLQPIVPKLQSLSFTVYSKSFDHTSFISTVQSRWIPDKVYAAKIGVSCLHSVELHLPSGTLNAEDYLPLIHLEKSGMHLVIGKR